MKEICDMLVEYVLRAPLMIHSKMAAFLHFMTKFGPFIFPKNRDFLSSQI